ncbi:o-succinylbenzoate--CoA ligase [Lederbergia citrea]|uniref:o-succinylbenzoate--CoA ligase n=1 Tax=Lederbergia citrea TaxID=2833581 RepID=UPI001BC92F71|nr:o-succinylbenzoate--CoA ligase [Lederbergia citrea]MBS4202484.1 o-succinylbenzoate--CoA ligase [Lederbergia citrea]
MGETIPNWLLQRAYLTPNRTALVFENQSWSFHQMTEIVMDMAFSLHSLELSQSNTVAVLMKNRPETVWVIHALQQIGVKTVFLNHRLTASELTFQIKDSGAEVIIYDGDFLQTVEKILSQYKIQAFTVDEINRFDKKELTETEFSLDRVCSIMYTSGTTGKPKGVMQTYGNHWWSAIGSSLNLGLQANDAWLCTVPIFHISGMSILMRSVIYGIPVYLMEQFDEKKANTLLQSGKITIMSAVSAMMNRMLAVLEDKTYHANFRCMLLGGGPAPRPLLEECLNKGIPVFQTYGMTETSSQIVTLSPEDSLKKIGSAGKPIFPSQIKVVSNSGQSLPNGEIGEITVKGPNVTIGYLNREKANEESFQDGWFSTGDLGHLDEEGFLYILDRRSDLIISGGENIYPAEIEEVLLEHDGVVEAGVTGVDDPIWGQVPYAFIVSKQVLSVEELFHFCHERLASYKVPKQIIQIKELPRNGSNKLMRRNLIQYID